MLKSRKFYASSLYRYRKLNLKKVPNNKTSAPMQQKSKKELLFISEGTLIKK